MLQFGRCCQQKTMWSLYNRSPHGGGEENGKKKRQKLMGWDKGSLTERANKVNSKDSNTDTKNMQNKQQNAQSKSHRPMPSTLPSHD